MLTLHGPATSPFVRKTWIALNEKGLEFAHRELDPLAKTPRFLAMNPLGRVPILEEGDGNLIADSSVNVFQVIANHRSEEHTSELQSL